MWQLKDENEGRKQWGTGIVETAVSIRFATMLQEFSIFLLRFIAFHYFCIVFFFQRFLLILPYAIFNSLWVRLQHTHTHRTYKTHTHTYEYNQLLPHPALAPTCTHLHILPLTPSPSSLLILFYVFLLSTSSCAFVFAHFNECS